MGFKSKRNGEIESNKSPQYTVSKPVKPSNNNLIINTEMRTKSLTDKEKEYYRLRSIEAINVIEQRYGFDLYDDNRYGGMHLNGENPPLNKSEKLNNDSSDLVNSEIVNSKGISALLSKINKNK